MEKEPQTERRDTQEQEFTCTACGQKFNSAAEVEQHERNCLNRKTSGA